MKRVIYFCICATAVAAVFRPLAHAADYSVQSDVQAIYEHDDNVQLTPGEGTSISGRHVSPSATAKMNTETMEARAKLDLDFQNFNRSEYDSDDQRLDLGLTNKTELSEFNLDGSYYRGSTRTSEFVGGEVGLQAYRRIEEAASTSWSHYVSDRQILSFSAGYNAVDYHDIVIDDINSLIEATQFVDRESYNGDVGWTFVYTERLRFTVQATGSEYKVDDSPLLPTYGFVEISQTTTAYGGALGVDYEHSEQFTLGGYVGQNNSDIQYELTDQTDGQCASIIAILFTPGCYEAVSYLEIGIDDQNEDYISGSVFANWAGERTSANFSYQRQEGAASSGVSTITDNYNMSSRYQLTERGALSLTLGYAQVQALDDRLVDTNARDSEYNTFEGSLQYEYQLVEDWYLSSLYRYREKQYDGTEDASSNVIYVSLTWRPQADHWSR